MKLIERYKLQLSGEALRRVFSDWRYVLLAVVLGVVFIEVLYWSRNLALAQYLLLSPDIDVGAKLQLLGSAFTAMFRSYGSVSGALLVIVGIAQGIALSLLVFVYRHRGNTSKRAASGSALASAAAFFGLGCAACGTSLITPLLSMLSSGAVYTVADTVGTVFSLVALLLVLYSIYYLGFIAYPLVQQRQPE